MEAAPMTHDNPMGGIDQNDTDSNASKREIHLTKPLAFWFSFLIIGMLVLLVIIPLLPDMGMATLKPALMELSIGILYLPGAIIFPLIVALWIGERVGMIENRAYNAVTIGLLNAVYTALIYVIGIFVVFLVLYYSGHTALLSISLRDFLIYLLAIPVSILIVLVPTFSAMSAARRKS
ncbi:MAG: hypothetical protein QXW10_01020 [Candidatus Micrarchaeaceae archaeon]